MAIDGECLPLLREDSRRVIAGGVVPIRSNAIFNAPSHILIYNKYVPFIQLRISFFKGIATEFTGCEVTIGTRATAC